MNAAKNCFITPEISQEDRKIICKNLFQYNVIATQEQLGKPDISINLALKGSDGQVYGGVLCDVFLYCLYIDVLWVDERVRGDGYGKALMLEAERIAKENGCTFAHTTTFSYQSPDFYQYLGYEIFGILDEYPNGIKQYFLKKKL